MPEYLAPGVFVEEIERGPRPIEGVPTSTAAFIGETERGPSTPRAVTSYIDYKRWFGDVFGDRDRYMPYAANGFFENGGKRLFVCRIVGEQATPQHWSSANSRSKPWARAAGVNASSPSIGGPPRGKSTVQGVRGLPPASRLLGDLAGRF